MRQGATWRGSARLGLAWPGSPGLGRAGRGTVRFGVAYLFFFFRRKIYNMSTPNVKKATGAGI